MIGVFCLCWEVTGLLWQEDKNGICLIHKTSGGSKWDCTCKSCLKWHLIVSRTTISYNSNGFIIIFLSVAHDWAQESLALTKQQIMRQRLWLRGVRQRPEFMLLPANCTPHGHIAELCAHTRQRNCFYFGVQNWKGYWLWTIRKVIWVYHVMFKQGGNWTSTGEDKKLSTSVGTEDRTILKTYFLSLLLHKSTIAWSKKIICLQVKENASLKNIQIPAHMKLFWSMCLLFKQNGECLGPGKCGGWWC